MSIFEKIAFKIALKQVEFRRAKTLRNCKQTREELFQSIATPEENNFVPPGCVI